MVTGIKNTVMWMNAKLRDALCVVAIALLALFPPAVLSNEAIIISEDKLLVFDETEVTIGAFEKFCPPSSLVAQAERGGGGLVYFSGCKQKLSWTWLTPYSQATYPDELAVHVTFDEAAQQRK